MTFDTEQFIMEIQRRPPLWDMSLDDYSNTELKKELWEELVEMFASKTMKVEQKQEMCHNLQKKWKNIRDCFTRELRRRKTGSTSKRKREYIYSDHLQFLTSTVTASEIDETSIRDLPTLSQENDENPADSHSVDNTTAQPSTKKRKNDDVVDKELIEILSKGLKKREETDNLQLDEDRMFLLSLLQDLKKIPEDIKLRTKIDLMVVLDKAKRGCASFDYPEYALV